MVEEQLKKEDQLFIHLVNTFVQSAWISLGKVKNPVTDTLDRNLEQATYYIDLLDMLQTKMKGNLSELKLNFIDEKKKGSGAPESSESASESDDSEKSDEKKLETSEIEKIEEKPKAKKKAKKTTKNDKKD